MSDRRIVARPLTDEPQALGFTPQEPMRHQAPVTVLRTIAREVSRMLTGVDSERRDPAVQTLPEYAHPELSYAEHQELWFDVAADTGDGFEATYAVARTLVEPTLQVGGRETRRGALLVLAGDLVYPFPGRRAYRDHLVGPYTAASPVEDAVTGPEVIALPGAHDWLDGLAGFRTTFVQGGWFGSWQLRQTRSYIAIALPHRYWLWGIDTDLGVDVDPQRKYFRDAASRLRAGDRVIVCGYRPLWQQLLPQDLGQLQGLHELAEQAGAELVLQVSGKHHFYARYATANGDTRAVVCGSSGAFLEDSNAAPKQVVVPTRPKSRRGDGGRGSVTGARDQPVVLHRKECFPSTDESHALARSMGWRIPWLALRLGVIASVVWSLGMYGALRTMPAVQLGDGNWLVAVDRIVGAGMLVISAVFLALTLLLARQGRGRLDMPAMLMGAAHALAHFAAGSSTTLLVSAHFDGFYRHVLVLVLLAIEMPIILTLYFFVSWLTGHHRAEIMPSLGVQDFKSFVRFHIGADGTLRMYPIGIPEVPRDWSLDTRGKPEDPWFTCGQSPAAFATLIHEPVELAPNAAQRAEIAAPVPLARDLPHDLFISYSRADAPWVRAFLDAFAQLATQDGLEDVRIFIDTESIRRGEYWRTRILDEITRCHCFVAVWSAAYSAAWRAKKMCFVEYEHAQRRELSQPGVVFDVLAAAREPDGAAGARQAIFLNDVAPDQLTGSAVFRRLYADLAARIRDGRTPRSSG
jgi:hypothetical protein